MSKHELSQEIQKHITIGVLTGKNPAVIYTEILLSHALVTNEQDQLKLEELLFASDVATENNTSEDKEAAGAVVYYWRLRPERFADFKPSIVKFASNIFTAPYYKEPKPKWSPQKRFNNLVDSCMRTSNIPVFAANIKDGFATLVKTENV